MTSLRRRLAARRWARAQLGPKLLEQFAAAVPTPYFVEIGANDGDQHDHLRPFILRGGWSGLMVEPVPHIFERLRRNYAGAPGVTPVNAAIAGRDGTLPFFHLAPAAAGDTEGLPSWYDAVGSFSREHVLRHRDEIPDLERRIVRADVAVLSFASLLERHAAPAVDLLVIDTEGHDGAILASIDLEAHRPRMVVYEHYHLAPGERRACAERMRAHGWHVVEEGFDTWCVRTGPNDGLSRLALRGPPGVRGLSVHDVP